MPCFFKILCVLVLVFQCTCAHGDEIEGIPNAADATANDKIGDVANAIFNGNYANAAAKVLCASTSGPVQTGFCTLETVTRLGSRLSSQSQPSTDTQSQSSQSVTQPSSSQPAPSQPQIVTRSQSPPRPFTRSQSPPSPPRPFTRSQSPPSPPRPFTQSSPQPSSSSRAPSSSYSSSSSRSNTPSSSRSNTPSSSRAPSASRSNTPPPSPSQRAMKSIPYHELQQESQYIADELTARVSRVNRDVEVTPKVNADNIYFNAVDRHKLGSDGYPLKYGHVSCHYDCVGTEPFHVKGEHGEQVIIEYYPERRKQRKQQYTGYGSITTYEGLALVDAAFSLINAIWG